VSALVGDRQDHSPDPAGAWAASGMMALTGPPDGPGLAAPPGLVAGATRLADDIARRSEQLGRPVAVEPLALMAERATITGLRRRGTVSCGGASHLMPTRDGWIALTLARPTDWELVPALLEVDPSEADDWPALQAAVATRPGRQLTERAELLGLPLAVLGERRPLVGHPGSGGDVHGIRSRRVRSAPRLASCSGLVVADLSALWAGPLVGRLLVAAGAQVIKVESPTRIDGARRGDPRFHAVMNSGKATVAIDFGTAQGRELLARLVSRVDVVITASRPRALEQLGLDPEQMVRHEQPRLWLMISGYGSAGASGHRVAFGDDAAAAGGLVGWDRSTPCFCGDAVADPLCGLAASSSALGALGTDGAWIIDASMADIAAGVTAPETGPDGLALPPPARSPHPDPPPPTPSVPPLGSDTAAVLRQLGIG
jgi:hypothetical protein